MALNICNSGHFDVEQFIGEIHRRNSIWNFKSKEYNDRARRVKDWEEVCECMVPDYLERTSDERLEIETELQNKWKVLRDCFVRSLRNQNRASSIGVTARPYKYHDLMSFLLATFRYHTRKRKYNYKNIIKKHEDTLKEQQEQDKDPFVEAAAKKIVKRMKLKTIEASSKPERKTDGTDDLVETITNNVVKRINNDNNDEDRQFLLCLLKDIKRIPTEMKLDAKSDIINVIRHYTSRANEQPIHLEYIEDPLVTMELSESGSENEVKVNHAKAL